MHTSVDVTFGAKSANAAYHICSALQARLAELGLWIAPPPHEAFQADATVTLTVVDTGWDPRSGQARSIPYTRDELASLATKAVTTRGRGAAQFAAACQGLSQDLSVDGAGVSPPRPQHQANRQKAPPRPKEIDGARYRLEAIDFARAAAHLVSNAGDRLAVRLPPEHAEACGALPQVTISADPRYVGNGQTVMMLTLQSGKGVISAVRSVLDRMSPST